MPASWRAELAAAPPALPHLLFPMHTFPRSHSEILFDVLQLAYHSDKLLFVLRPKRVFVRGEVERGWRWGRGSTNDRLDVFRLRN